MSSTTDDLPNNLLIFQATVSKIFEDITKCVSEKEFISILDILNSKPSVLSKLHKVMEDDLLKALNQDLQALVTDECLIDGMKKVNELDHHKSKVWRPTGNVKQQLQSLDAKRIKNESLYLTSYLENLQQKNNTLKNKILERRKIVQSLNKRMKKLVNMPFKLSEFDDIIKTNEEKMEKFYQSDREN